MGIPRSKLFAMALEEFISKYNEKMITEKINEVYEKIDQKEFEPYLNAGLEPIRNLTKLGFFLSEFHNDMPAPIGQKSVSIAAFNQRLTRKGTAPVEQGQKGT